jgi:hypothetical protein
MPLCVSNLIKESFLTKVINLANPLFINIVNLFSNSKSRFIVYKNLCNISVVVISDIK